VTEVGTAGIGAVAGEGTEAVRVPGAAAGKLKLVMGAAMRAENIFGVPLAAGGFYM
jgi:hypothetical protein